MPRKNSKSSRPNGRNRANTAQQGQPPFINKLPPQGWTTPLKSYRTGRPTIKSYGDRIRVTNTEIALEVTGTATAGNIPAGGAIRVFRFSNVAGPTVFMDQQRWLTKLALAYDKFKIINLKLRYVPSLPVTWGGQVALRWDSDPGKIAPDANLVSISGDMLAKVTQVANACENQVRTDQLNRLPQYENFSSANDTGVGTVGSINLAYSAITAPSNTTAGTGIVIGYVWMDYTVEFFNPSNVVTA